MERTDSGIRRYAKYAAIVICKWMIRIVNRCRSPICWVSWGKWLNRIFVLIEFCCVEFNWECTHFAHSKIVESNIPYVEASTTVSIFVSTARELLHKCRIHVFRFTVYIMNRISSALVEILGIFRIRCVEVLIRKAKKPNGECWCQISVSSTLFTQNHTDPSVYVSHAHTHTQSQHKLRWI